MEKDYSSIERVRVSKVKIKIEKLYKIFGPKAKEMTQEVKNGVNKDELLAKYNHVLGLDNINLDIVNTKYPGGFNFNQLLDITAVDYPSREFRFDLIYIL